MGVAGQASPPLLSFWNGSLPRRIAGFAKHSIAAAVLLGAAIVCPLHAQVVLSEIHYHPVEIPAFQADGTPTLQLTNDLHEFVEIQNAGPTAVDLGGWSLAGGISYRFPTNTIIQPGAFFVIAKIPARLAAVYSLNVSQVLGPYSGFLGNGSDTVRLRDASGNAVDSVTFDSRFPWAQSADALGAQDRFTGLSSAAYQYKGRSLQRVSVGWPSGDPANWLASPLTGPTPGGPQAITRSIPKPVVVAFSAVQSSDGATLVRANQPVSVDCTFSATNGLEAVALEYFTQNVNLSNQVRTALNMTPLGGGKYTATIPGQTNRALVRYRFTANRGDGAEVVSPRADDPQIAPTGLGGALEAWHGYFVAPVRSTLNAAIYDVFVSTGGLSRMSLNVTQNPKRVTAATATGLPRDVPYVAAAAPQWNGTVYGVFACDGKLYDIHIRYHGSRFHRAPSNHSYKLHFPEHLPFNDQSSWFETLHGQEFIEAQKINRLVGLPASRMRRVDWYLNSGVNEVHSEQGEYAGEMLDAYHELQQQLNPGSKKEETGELYKDVGNRDATQNNLEGPYTRGDVAPMLANAGWSQLDRFSWTYTLQNHAWKGPKPFRDVMEAMWTARGDTPATHTYSSNSASFAAVKAWYINNWDIDSILTSMAILEWMGIWDDAAQNCFYWRRASGKWSRLGWDYDGVMSIGIGGLGGTTNQTIFGAEYGAPTVFDGVNWWKDTFYKTFRPEYTRRLWELNNSFFDPANLAAQGLTTASRFATNRRAYVNSQLSAYGTYTKPARPANVFPTAGLAVVGETNLVTTAYTHPQAAAHYATLWEIRAVSGNYENPVFRALTANTTLTIFPIPFDQLTYGQTYYWRATHVDSNLHPSIVSAETGFTWGTTNPTAGTLVLNEILAYNRNTVQNGNDYPDFIELRNNNSASVLLDGYSLTDDPAVPAKFPFPSGTTILSGGYLLVWCDKETSAPGLHSGFGLDEEGETVLLMNGATIVDSVNFGPQAPDISIGRIVNGTGGWQANIPTPATANSAQPLGSANNLRLNEWMAEPAYGEDWFEIYNNDANPVGLAGLYVSDTPSTPTITKLPTLSFIAGKGYTRLWADGNNNGKAHCNFKLGKSGESLVLTAANGVTAIDTVTFSLQENDMAQGRLPDGDVSIVSFTNTASPGFCNWATAPVIISELIANSSTPFEDAIELFNLSSNSVNIGGWWLTDDLNNARKFQISAGTTLPPGEYWVLYAADLSGGLSPFEFNASGDEAMLSAADSAGNLTGYGSLVRFGASPNNSSFGRVAATGLGCSSGGAEFWPQASHTFGQDNPADVTVFRQGTGQANGEPRIGPITINEIMYHPPDLTNVTATSTNIVDNTLAEYIELFNPTATGVSLNGWRLKGDAEFHFPAGATIPANGYALVVSFDPTNVTALSEFRTKYQLSTDALVYGPYSESLANSTFDVELAYPSMVAGYTNYINVDKLEYRDRAPWPTSVDGQGDSLQRVDTFVIANTAANWSGSTPTPVAVNSGVIRSLTITTASPLPGGVAGQAYRVAFAVAGGIPPFSWVTSAGSTPGLTLSIGGVLTGVLPAAGTNVFTVRVTDSFGATNSRAFTLPVAYSAPVIASSATLPLGTQGMVYGHTLTGAGGVTPYAWSLVAGALPPGLVLTGAGVITGTPTHYGTYAFTAKLTDAIGLTATAAFSLQVTVPPLVINTASTLPSAQEGIPYSQALSAAGGIPPYAWTLAAGSLPPGLSMSSMGDLAGTPATQGTYSFTVRATDSLGTNTTKAVLLTVQPKPLVIVTTGLPDGIFGRPYFQALAAHGGTPPYGWSITWGAMPPGLMLPEAGIISGTPTNSGTFSFIVQVSDQGTMAVSTMLTISVQNNAPVLTAGRLLSGAIELTVDGDPYQDYAIEASSNLVDWATSFTTNTVAMPFRWTDPGSASRQFFRVRMGP